MKELREIYISRRRIIMSENIINKILKRIPRWKDIYFRLSMDIAQQIDDIIRKDGIKQAELAKKLGKHESEISKWLSGNHNFTLKTLAKLEDILEERIIFIANEFQEYLLKPEIQYTTNATSAEGIEIEKNYDIESKRLNKKTITIKNNAISLADAA